MTALPRQDQLFDDPIAATDTPDEQPTANGERRATSAYPPVKDKAVHVRASDPCRDIYKRATGNDYVDHPKDLAVWGRLKKLPGGIPDIEARWTIAVAAEPTNWVHCDNIYQLGTKWNELGTLLAKQRPAQPVVGDCQACGGRGECGLWRLTICYRCYAAWLEDDATTRALDAACAAEDYPRAHAVAMTWARERFTKRSGT